MLIAQPPFNIKADQPRIKGHRANVLDLEFSPFSSDLLAATFDDSSVLLYKIPEGGLKEHMTQEVQIYQKHTKKVPFVTFNPIASDVLCTSAFNGEIHIWNAIKGDSFCELNSEDTPTWASWSPNGDLFGVTTKSKFLNVLILEPINQYLNIKSTRPSNLQNSPGLIMTN